MRYKNNIGPQVRRRRYALGWSQSILAAKLQIAGFDISRSGVSKIEARLSYVDDKALALSRGSSEGAGAGTFPAANAGQSNLRIHRETGDDEVLNANAASSNPTALGRCSEAGAPYPSGSLKIAEMETQTQAAPAKGGDQERLAYLSRKLPIFSAFIISVCIDLFSDGNCERVGFSAGSCSFHDQN